MGAVPGEIADTHPSFWRGEVEFDKVWGKFFPKMGKFETLD